MVTSKDKSLSGTNQFNSRTGYFLVNLKSIWDLKQFNIDCGPGKVLQGFRILSRGDFFRKGYIAYEYACLANPNVTENTYDKKNGWSISSVVLQNDYNFTLFEENNNLKGIICKQGFAIQQFQLIAMPGYPNVSMDYQYRCVEVLNLTQCLNKEEKISGNTSDMLLNFRRTKLPVEIDRILTFLKPFVVMYRRPDEKKYTGSGSGLAYFGYKYTSCIIPKKSNRPKFNFSKSNFVNNNNDESKKKILEGNKFCKTNCVPNFMSKPKKCWMKGVKDCNSCQFKDQRNNNNNKRDADSLCKSTCNAIKNSYICAFYPFTNDMKKIVNQNILSKFNVRLFRRYLKK